MLLNYNVVTHKYKHILYAYNNGLVIYRIVYDDFIIKKVLYKSRLFKFKFNAEKLKLSLQEVCTKR